jgi:beta-lactamase regulating signal transducer with metallopeptidase domain
MNVFDFLSFWDAVGFSASLILVTFFWQSTLLILLVLPTAWALRNRSAAVRHSLWLAVLIAAPFLPVLTFFAKSAGVPQASIPVLTAYETSVMTSGAPYVPVENLIPLTVEGTRPVSSSTSVSSAPTKRGVIARGPGKLFQLKSLFDYPWAIVFSSYLLVTGVLLIRFVLGVIRIRHWIRSGVLCLDDVILNAMRAAQQTVGHKRPIPVLQSDRVHSPIAAGVIRPVVLVPENFVHSIGEDELKIVTVHETAHIKRRDPLVLHVVRFVNMLFWFHPLVWLVTRHMVVLSELAADEAVLKKTGEPIRYAKFLTKLAEDLSPKSSSSPLVAGIAFTKSTFLHRIEAVLSEPRSRFKKLPAPVRLATLSACAAGLLIAASIPIAQVDSRFALSNTVSSAENDESEKSDVIFKGRYQHRNRGGAYGTPTELVLTQTPNAAVTASMSVGDTKYTATGDKNNRIVEYEFSKAESGGKPGYSQKMRIEDGVVYRTQRGIREDEDDRKVDVPSGAQYDPNSRPDPYVSANIILRGLSLKEGESTELDVYDVDNSGDGYVGYKIRLENLGKETVEVPAGLFEATHINQIQLKSADTWFKKRAGHITDFWVLDNGIIVRIYRHREPYELLLESYETPATLPGQMEFLNPQTTLTFKATIDGSDTFHIREDRAWYEHHQWKHPFGTTLINGEEWTPEWETPRLSSPATLGTVPFKNSQIIRIKKRAGRGTISITEKPTIENNYTLSILINDGGYGGEDTYEFDLIVSDKE